MPRFKSVIEWGMGMGAQRVIARVSASIGVARKRNGEDVEGRTGSLMNNLTPSAIGCKSP